MEDPKNHPKVMLFTRGTQLVAPSSSRHRKSTHPLGRVMVKLPKKNGGPWSSHQHELDPLIHSWVCIYIYTLYTLHTLYTLQIYIYIEYIYICLHIYIQCIYIYSMYVHISTYLYIHIYLYTYISTYIYTYINQYIYIYLYTYIYIYINRYMKMDGMTIPPYV